MELGQLIYVLGRLILGAAASFLAIMLWPRTRDLAWIFVIIGSITAYVETVFSVLILFGIVGEGINALASFSPMSILLPCLSTAFFIAAFAIMVARKYRR
jgi:hypothetical protein